MRLSAVARWPSRQQVTVLPCMSGHCAPDDMQGGCGRQVQGRSDQGPLVAVLNHRLCHPRPSPSPSCTRMQAPPSSATRGAAWTPPTTTWRQVGAGRGAQDTRTGGRAGRRAGTGFTTASLLPPLQVHILTTQHPAPIRCKPCKPFRQHTAVGSSGHLYRYVAFYWIL